MKRSDMGLQTQRKLAGIISKGAEDLDPNDPQNAAMIEMVHYLFHCQSLFSSPP